MGLNISPSIWQSYINTILKCLQSGKQSWMIYCSFTPSKRVHIANLEDLLKALLKNSLKISPKKMLAI